VQYVHQIYRWIPVYEMHAVNLQNIKGVLSIVR